MVTSPVVSAGIVHQVLQHRRQQREGAGHDQPDREHQSGARYEIRALEQVAMEKRAAFRGYRVHGEQVKTEPRDRRCDPDFARMEPVLQLAAVEHQLQGADPQAQRQEPDEIERFTTHVAGLADENKDAQRAQHADRQVDVEDPAPAVVIGQPAAERRPHDRAEDRADAEYGHRMPVALRRVDLEQGGLRQRDQPGPGHALQRTKENELIEACGGAAQRRCERKTDDRDQKNLLDAEPAGEPAGQRHHDRGADDIGGQRPGDLVQ